MTLCRDIERDRAEFVAHKFDLALKKAILRDPDLRSSFDQHGDLDRNNALALAIFLIQELQGEDGANKESFISISSLIEDLTIVIERAIALAGKQDRDVTLTLGRTLDRARRLIKTDRSGRFSLLLDINEAIRLAQVFALNEAQGNGRKVSSVSRWIAGWALAVLPSCERVAYSEIFASELAELSKSKNWLAQVIYALRVLVRAPILGRELRAPDSRAKERSL